MGVVAMDAPDDLEAVEVMGVRGGTRPPDRRLRRFALEAGGLVAILGLAVGVLAFAPDVSPSRQPLHLVNPCGHAIDVRLLDRFDRVMWEGRLARGVTFVANVRPADVTRSWWVEVPQGQRGGNRLTYSHWRVEASGAATPPTACGAGR